MTDRLRIGFDMDEVICDTNGALIDWVHDRYGITGDPGRDATEGLSPEQLRAGKEMLDEGSIFADLAPMPGAIETLRDIDSVHEVFIITAAMEHPGSFAPKYQWVRQHLPFFDPMRLVFCGDKSMADVDYLVDDSPRHFERLRGEGIVFTAPRNLSETRYRRVDNWADIRRLFLEGGL